MKRRRLLILLVIAILAGSALIVHRWQAPTGPDGVLLSSGRFRVRFLAADVGRLTYTSEDQLRAFLRKYLPSKLSQLLGPVPPVFGMTASSRGLGEKPLILLFQLLDPDGSPQNSVEIVFERIEFEDSSGFVLKQAIQGYSSSGQGSSFHQFSVFPRRDRQLTFRLYERGGNLVMQKTIPNPGFVESVTEWQPEALPVTKTVEGLSATLTAVRFQVDRQILTPHITFESADPNWSEPHRGEEWADATGNIGPWLSPHEPAWKLLLTLHQRPEATFPPASTLVIDPCPLPEGLSLQTLDRTEVVDGIPLTIRYVAPAGAVHEDAGVVTVKPPQSPGRTGMSTSAGMSWRNGRHVPHSTIENGLPWIRVEHPPLPREVRLLCDVRDQDGKLLNEKLHPSQSGINGVSFQAVSFQPRPETKTVQLTVRVSRPRKFEFVVEPPRGCRMPSRRRPG